MNVALVSAALLVIPVIGGLAIGRLLQIILRRPLRGAIAAMVVLIAPLPGALWLLRWQPVVGLWDAVFEAGLLGLGILYGSHRWFPGWRERALTGFALLTSFGMVEILYRAAALPTPRFPATSSGPNLLLADAMQANSAVQGWDIGSNEVVCSVAYGEQYVRTLVPNGLQVVALPHTYRPTRPRRILHVGDSMVHGLGVLTADRFTARLARLDPDTEHINAGLPGTAPDAYLAQISAWVRSHPLSLIVVYLYEANDLEGLDAPSPCCGFEPILQAGEGRLALRCPQALAFDLHRASPSALRLISPPPYLLRAMIPHSVAASHLAMALVSRKVGGTVTEAAQTRLRDILGTIADIAATHQVPVVVVLLPDRYWMERATGERSPTGARMAEIARAAGLTVYDPGAPLRRAAAESGLQPFLGAFDGHFSAAGHAFLADWLLATIPHMRAAHPADDGTEPRRPPAQNVRSPASSRRARSASNGR